MSIESSQRRFADCHIHTDLSGHAEHSLPEVLAALRESSLVGAIVTEHLPLPISLDPECRVSLPQRELYAYVRALQEEQQREEGPRLVVGGEADWLDYSPTWADRSVSEARAAGVEVILGSVHMLDKWAFDDPAEKERWHELDVDTVWANYFEQWCIAARSGLFDVMAHPDLPKKFGFVPDDPQQYYVAAAEAAAEAGVLCEVSTAGLRKDCAELYPAPAFIRELAARGVGFTLGSDAHSTVEIADQFDAAAALLISLGITHQAFPLGLGNTEWLPLQ